MVALAIDTQGLEGTKTPKGNPIIMPRRAP